MKLSSIHYVFTLVALALLGAGVISLRGGWDFLLRRPLALSDFEVPTGSSIDEVDKKLPSSFPVKTMDGREMEFEAYLSSTDDSSKWIILHFWATWCPPCREELLVMRDFMQRVPDFRVVQISVDYRMDEVADFMKKIGLTLGMHDVIDPGGGNARRFGTTKFPETYLVSPVGRAVLRFVGPQNWLHPQLIEVLRQARSRRL